MCHKDGITHMDREFLVIRICIVHNNYLYGSHSSDVHAASEADARLACFSALSVFF